MVKLLNASYSMLLALTISPTICCESSILRRKKPPKIPYFTSYSKAFSLTTTVTKMFFPDLL